jgi:hypothetical protein
MGTLSAEELAFIQQVDDEERERGVLDAERSALLAHVRAQADLITAQQRTIELQGNEVRSLEAQLRSVTSVLSASPCNCYTTGRASFPPSPDDYSERQWCGRCRALGLDQPAALSAQRGGE